MCSSDRATIARMGMAGDREPARKMWTELTRDAGMLALVFGSLDALIKTSAGEEHLVAWWWYPALTAVSMLDDRIWHLARTQPEGRPVTPNQSFIASLAWFVVGVLGIGAAALLVDKWEAHQRSKTKQKP